MTYKLQKDGIDRVFTGDWFPSLASLSPLLVLADHLEMR